MMPRKYFISYRWSKGTGFGFGRADLDLDVPICDASILDLVCKKIAESENLDKVIPLYWREFEPDPNDSGIGF